VLDELCVATGLKLITQEDANRLIDVVLSTGKCIVTGRDAQQWLINRATTYLSLKQRIDCSEFFDLAQLGEGNIAALF